MVAVPESEEPVSTDLGRNLSDFKRYVNKMCVVMEASTQNVTSFNEVEKIRYEIPNSFKIFKPQITRQEITGFEEVWQDAAEEMN